MLSHDSFGSFYLEQYPRVVLFLLALGASEPEAEDAAQEAMAQAAKAWTRLSSPAAWVRKAARHSYIRQAQKNRKESSALAQAGRAEATDSQSDIDLREEQWRVVALMRKLPPEQGAVAALFYDGLTHEEIARVLDKTVGTSRSLLRHAKIRLKEVIQSEGVGTRNAGR